MLPTELTSEQKEIPDLTDKQLQDLGFKSNHEWKLNAEMLGFSRPQSIEDFIEEKLDRKIKTLLSGKPINIYEFYDTVSLDNFPIAFEGDVIISERWFIKDSDKTENWCETKLFTTDQPNIIRCSHPAHAVPTAGTAREAPSAVRFQMIYGKYTEKDKKDNEEIFESFGIKETQRFEKPESLTESALHKPTKRLCRIITN